MNVRLKNHLLERFDKRDSLEVMELRAPIQELLRSPGWKLVEEILTERIKATRQLMETGAHEHAEYTMFIGELRGMQSVEAIIDAVLTGSERAAQKAAQLAAEEN